MSFKPGEIHLLQLENGKPRFVIVVSRERLNRGDYVVVVPLTTKRLSQRSELPNRVPFRKGSYGLHEDCVAQADAITLLEQTEIVSDVPIATLKPEDHRALIHAIGYVIESECEPV